MKRLIKGIFNLMIAPLLLATPSAQAEVISVKTMQDVQTKIEHLLKNQKPEDILVAFDIDMTLTQPDHPATYYPALRKYADTYKATIGKLTPEQKDLASTLLTQIVPQKLAEQKTPEILKSLQQKGVKVIALSSFLSGKNNGYTDKMIILRHNQLQKMGYDFSKSFDGILKVKNFSEFKKYAGSYPIFYNGILSTNGEGDTSKGNTLIAFLKHISLDQASNPAYIPKVIVFIDDKKKHIKDVETYLKSYNPSIQFIGIEYMGTYNYAPQNISKEDFQKFWQQLAEKVKTQI